MKKHEYINDFIYFTVRPEKKGDKDILVYCSGINLDRFLPMTRGRLGLGSNPILSGLKLVKYDLCTLALSYGATPMTIAATPTVLESPQQKRHGTLRPC